MAEPASSSETELSASRTLVPWRVAVTVTSVAPAFSATRLSDTERTTPVGASSSSSMVVVTGEPLMVGAGPPPPPAALERLRVKVSSAPSAVSSVVVTVIVWSPALVGAKVRVPEAAV